MEKKEKRRTKRKRRRRGRKIRRSRRRPRRRSEEASFIIIKWATYPTTNNIEFLKSCYCLL